MENDRQPNETPLPNLHLSSRREKRALGLARKQCVARWRAEWLLSGWACVEAIVLTEPWSRMARKSAGDFRPFQPPLSNDTGVWGKEKCIGKLERVKVVKAHLGDRQRELRALGS